MNLKQKMILAPGLILVLMVALFYVVNYLYVTVDKKIVYPQFRESVLDGSRISLKATVDLGADMLAEALHDVSDPEARNAVIYRYTEPARFFDRKG